MAHEGYENCAHRPSGIWFYSVLNAAGYFRTGALRVLAWWDGAAGA